MIEEMLLGSYLDELDRALVRASRIAEARAGASASGKRRVLGRVLGGRFGSLETELDQRSAA